MASGDTLLILTPLSNEAPNADYATLDVRNEHPVLDFEDAGTKEAVFTGVLPRSYAGGGLTVNVHFAMSSATSGNVVWNAEIERMHSTQDIDSAGFAAAQSHTEAAPGTNGYPAVAEITFTDGAQMDSLAAGEAFRIRISRDGGNGSDTASGDAELLAVEIKET